MALAPIKTSPERPRARTRNCRTSLLLSIVAVIFLEAASAFTNFDFAPMPIHVASAASAVSVDQSGSDTGTVGSGLKAPSAEGTAADDGENCEGPPPNEAVGLPRLLEASPDDPSVRSIRLGESIRFEEMGPVIINADGTTRRIANWDQMTQGEQQVAWRRISKRNEERRKVLLEMEERRQKETEAGEEEEGE